MKINPDKFDLFLEKKKIIWWIFVMRSSQKFWRYKLKLFCRRSRGIMWKKPVKKLMRWLVFHLCFILNKDYQSLIHLLLLIPPFSFIFKVIIGFAPNMKNYFKIIEITNSNMIFLNKRHNVWSVNHGTERPSFIGPKIWDTLPNGWTDAT